MSRADFPVISEGAELIDREFSIVEERRSGVKIATIRDLWEWADGEHTCSTYIAAMEEAEMMKKLSKQLDAYVLGFFGADFRLHLGPPAPDLELYTKRALFEILAKVEPDVYFQFLSDVNYVVQCDGVGVDMVWDSGDRAFRYVY